jgi:hypothetical protein
MKVREILLFNNENWLTTLENSLLLIRSGPVLDQIQPSNRMAGPREQMASHGIPAAANPDNVPGIEPPRQVGIKPMRVVPIATQHKAGSRFD